MESRILEFSSETNTLGQGDMLTCQVEVSRDLNLVIATQIGESADVDIDVDKNVEAVANTVVREFDLNPHGLCFIENYGDNTPIHSVNLIEFCVDERTGLRRRQLYELPVSMLNLIRSVGKGPDFGRMPGNSVDEDSNPPNVA